jgi:hypothetical protein
MHLSRHPPFLRRNVGPRSHVSYEPPQEHWEVRNLIESLIPGRGPWALGAGDLFRVPGFATAFAVYLLQHPDAWRMRRVDRFCPLDLVLAEHRVTIQGQIHPVLLHQFFETDGAVLGLRSFTVFAGDELTLYVPALRRPKLLLMNFAIDAQGGTPAALLTRGESAIIGAIYFLNRLLGRRAHEIPADEARRLHIVVASLIFQEPLGLGRRVQEWAWRRGRVFLPNQPLKTADLRDWVCDEGDLFVQGLGTELRHALEDVLKHSAETSWGVELPVMDPLSEDMLRHFPTLESLLMHNIRDLLKLIMEFAPPSRDDDTPPQLLTREELLASPAAFGSFVATQIVPALEELRAILRSGDPTLRQALVRELTSWTAYVMTTARVGAPFTLNVSQTLPLNVSQTSTLDPSVPDSGLARWLDIRRRGFYRVSQEYPLALRDAASVHLEVSIPDPELRFSPAVGHVEQDLSLIARLPDARRAHVATTYGFGAASRPSDRLLHLYTSRRREEGPRLSSQVSLKLFVPLKLANQIRAGYATAAAVFLFGAVYIFVSMLRWFIGQRTQPAVARIFTVSTVTVTLSLWLTTAQHKRPLVNRMLLPYRACFYLSVGVILVSLAALADDWAASRTFAQLRWASIAALGAGAATLLIVRRRVRRSREPADDAKTEAVSRDA